MTTWLLLFLAAVAVAFLTIYVLLRPSSFAAKEHENVVEFPRERREKIG